jgi:tetratricopeptide (TPR) repeat protein
MLGAKQAQARAKVQIDEFKKNLALQFGRKQIFEPLQKGLLAIVREMRSLAHNDPIRENFTSGLTKVNELDREGAKMSPAKEEKEQETKVYDSLQELLGFTKETLETCFSFGLHALQNNNLEEAHGIFLFLTECNPFFFEPWLYLGQCQEKEEDFQSAVASYYMAIINNMQSAHAFLRSAISQAKLGNRSDAQEALRFAEKLRPEWTSLEFQDYEELKKII